MVGADLIDGEKVYILEFRDKVGKFPGEDKTSRSRKRIYAAETGRILQSPRDNTDRYTKSIRYSGPLQRATETSFVMTYCQINGKLYTDRITKKTCRLG